jgi:hypothetical protein
MRDRGKTGIHAIALSAAIQTVFRLEVKVEIAPLE